MIPPENVHTLTKASIGLEIRSATPIEARFDLEELSKENNFDSKNVPILFLFSTSTDRFLQCVEVENQMVRTDG